MSDHDYYSISYKAQDFSVKALHVAYDGTIVGSEKAADFAKLAPSIANEDIRRPLIEGLAREFAAAMNKAYDSGWTDGSEATAVYQETENA